MYICAVTAILLAAVAEARFGQEQGDGALAAIGALTNLGQPGQAATLQGTSVQFLLAGANPCGKLSQADLVVSELGSSDVVIAAARGLVAAEQNFNPFVVNVPSICSDPTLPTTAALRGVVPLIDPAVLGEALENANANSSKINPFNADGLSVAQVMVAHGFSNFTAVALDGTSEPATDLPTTAAAAATASNAASSAVASTAATSSAAAVNVVAASSSISCGGTTFVTVTRAATSSPAAVAASVVDTTAAVAATTSAEAATAVSAASSTSGTPGTCTGSGELLLCTSPSVGFGAVTNPVTGNFAGFVPSTIAGLNFGLCVPTMKFEAGLDGRADTAFTFQGIDPLINKGQEEALDPTIITTQITNQLINVCGANAAAKSAAAAAGAQIAALGTRDVSTADAWNTALGFAGTNTNPDNAPQTGLVGHD